MNNLFSRCKSALSFLLCLCLCASSLCLVSEQEAFAAGDSSGWDGEYIDFFAGYDGFMALRSNGTVAIKEDDKNREELLGWTDVVKLLPGSDVILGLRSDGTVLISGKRSDEFSEVRNWKNVKDILGGHRMVFGLTNSGLVLTAGEFMSPGLDVSEISKWRNVEQLVYGSGGYDDSSIIGLCSNGKVVGMGERWAQRGWEGSFSGVGYVYTDGWISGCIKTDGKAQIWGTNSGHQDSEWAEQFPEYFETDPDSPEPMYLQISRWKDLRQIFFMETHAVGLKSDGSVYHTSSPLEELDESLKQLDSWSDIEKLYYRDYILLGLRADGTVKVFEPCEFYYPHSFRSESEAFTQLRDEIAAWQDIADIKICSGAVIGCKTDGSTVVSAPIHEEFIQADRKAAGIVPNTIISPKKDKAAIVDFALSSNNALVAWRNDGTVYSQGLDETMSKEVSAWTDIESAGFWTDFDAPNAVYGIKKDGTVVFSGPWDYDDEPWGFAKSWKNVAQIESHGQAMVLLRDGRVHDRDGNFLKGWDNIEQIDLAVCPSGHTWLGLSKDGKLFSADRDDGYEYGADLELPAFTLEGKHGRLVSLDSNAFMFAAVDKDGRIVSTHPALEEELSTWRGITQACVGNEYRTVMALTKDGRVKVATVDDPEYFSPLDDWEDIVRLYFCDFGIQSQTVIGIRSDGKLNIFHHNNELDPMLQWENVKKLAGNEYTGFFAALTEDGQLLTHQSVR